MMKKLPLGFQDFDQLVEDNCVYVDKTQLIHQLVTTGSYYFLSRPRRFGKSLLLSTLGCLFKGNKNLFSGLWIEDNWDWSATHPVLHLSFAVVDYQNLELGEAISDTLIELAESEGLTLLHKSYKSKFLELIKKISEKYQKK
jgi:hypothetical protein